MPSDSLFTVILAALFCLAAPFAAANQRPNILWITTEDHGPYLGTYGFDYAHTPNIDAFAERSLRYDIAWSNAPVCAPARTTIITGIYATSTGGQHMRSDVRIPSSIQQFPQLLREAGYYCTNNAKEDYNVSGASQIWDDSSRQAHYKNRVEGQPFLAVFNIADSHESRIRHRTELPHHDPDKVPVPPYHPDTPEVRRDWAQHHHSITRADAKVGQLLEELQDSGLADETIVFFYSDHGSGLPGHKRWPHNRGLQVPFIVHVPEKFLHLAPSGYRPGGSTRRPIGFVDLAPTLLSLAGLPQPDWMQGEAFMGPGETKEPAYLFGFRGRMDERFDLVRSVRNDRYVYIRNYMPHLIYGQYLAYMFQTETTQVWQNLYRENKLDSAQSYFWEPKPAEELYDLAADPHEMNNLAKSEEHAEVLDELRNALRTHILTTRDAGFLPEAEMHRRAGKETIYEMAQDKKRYPLERIYQMAETAARRDAADLPRLVESLRASDPAIRYWAVLGIQIRGKKAFDSARDEIRAALRDSNPSVQIAAAAVLIDHGSEADIDTAAEILAELAPPDRNGAYVAMAATSAITQLDDNRLERLKPLLREMPLKDPDEPDRPNDYVRRHVAAILEETN